MIYLSSIDYVVVYCILYIFDVRLRGTVCAERDLRRVSLLYSVALEEEVRECSRKVRVYAVTITDSAFLRNV